MLAYASHRPVVADRRPAPHAMLAIIAGHVALVAAVMSARMDLPPRIVRPPLVVDLIREPVPPPPAPPNQRTPETPRTSVLDQPVPLVPVPTPTPADVDSTPTPVPDFDALIGPAEPLPNANPTPATPTTAARLLTSASELKPAYPPSKLASGEEALLRLKLTIDQRGRVVGVEPIGRADRTFVDAARRHLMARWRYQPASEGGRAVASTAVITLRFQLEG